MGYKVAVVGATGNVGQGLLQIMAEREFPADEVVALASERSIGREVSYGEDEVLKVQDLAAFDFKGTDSSFSREDAAITLKSESDFQLQQMLDMLQGKLNKRGVDIINRLDLGLLRETRHARRATVRQYPAPSGGVEDLAWDGSVMWTSDESVFRFFKGVLD